MKNFALKSHRFRGSFATSLFVVVCCLGLVNICNAEANKTDNSKFDALESKYTTAQNDYKTSLNKIESILEKTKTIKTRADNAKNKAIVAAKKAIAKRKEADKQTPTNAQTKESEYMSATFKVMEISDDARTIASKASAELNRAKTIKGKIEGTYAKAKEGNSVALSKFEAIINEYENAVKKATTLIGEFEALTNEYEKAVSEFEKTAKEYEEATLK